MLFLAFLGADKILRMGDKKMAKKMKVLCCLVVIAILMSTMPASVFAIQESSSSETVSAQGDQGDYSLVVKFKGTATTDENKVDCCTCYGSYYCNVKVEELLSNPGNRLKSGDVYTVCYGYSSKSIKTGDTLEVYGEYFHTGGAFQHVGNIVAYNDGYYIKKKGSQEETKPTHPSPKIVEVKFPPACVKEDEYARISVSVENNGGSSSEGYISVSFPNDEYIPRSMVSGTGNEYNTLYQKKSEIWGKDGKIKSVDPLVELFERNWDAGESHTLTMNVKPNSGSDEIVFYVRAALKNDADESYERDPNSGYKDQQGWYAERHVIDVCQEHSFELISPDITSKLELYKTHNVPIKVKSATTKGGTIVASLKFTSKFGNSPREKIINLNDNNFDGIYEYDYSLEPFEQIAIDSINASIKTKDAEAVYNSICDYFSSTIGTYKLTLKYYDASSEKTDCLYTQSRYPIGLEWKWKWEIEKYINELKPPSEQMWGGHWTTLEDVNEGMTETVLYLSEDNEGTAYLDLAMTGANLLSFGTIGLIYGVTEANSLRIIGEEDKANEMLHETLANFVIGNTPAGKAKLFYDVANDLSIIFKGEKIFTIRSECPVNLHMYDSSNNHVGLDEYGNPETEIPYSIYTQDENGDFEGIIIIDFDSDDFYKVMIEGTGNGKFNLTSEIIGHDKKQKIAYLNVPVYTNTVATVAVSTSNPTYTMEIDNNGDGTTDYTNEPDSIETIGAESPVHNLNTGEDFATIQNAIDDLDTQDDNTITVDPGTYTEHLVIDKPLKLMGDDKSTTIIEGRRSEKCVIVTADNVEISGFMIQNSTYGIWLESSDGCTISRNIIQDNCDGIYLTDSNNNAITNNIIFNNVFSISGIHLSSSHDNEIRDNDLVENGVGVSLSDSNNNRIYHNNFVDGIFRQAHDNSGTNSWDNGPTGGGNYWSDHGCIGNPSAKPYYIDNDGVDHYPFQESGGWLKGNQPPVNPTLSPDKSEPQSAGAAITWTASATDPDGDPLYYLFRLKGPATGNSWQIMRDWSTDNTWTWYTSSPGGDTDVSGWSKLDIAVWIRDGHHAPSDRYDLEKIYFDYYIYKFIG